MIANAGCSTEGASSVWVDPQEEARANDRHTQVGDRNRRNTNRHAARWLVMWERARRKYDDGGDDLNGPQKLAKLPRVPQAWELLLMSQPLKLPRQKSHGPGGNESNGERDRISDLKPAFLCHKDAAKCGGDNDRRENTAYTLPEEFSRVAQAKDRSRDVARRIGDFVPPFPSDLLLRPFVPPLVHVWEDSVIRAERPPPGPQQLRPGPILCRWSGVVSYSHASHNRRCVAALRPDVFAPHVRPTTDEPTEYLLTSAIVQIDNLDTVLSKQLGCS